MQEHNNARRYINAETGEIIDNVARIYTDEQLAAIEVKKKNERDQAEDGRHFIQCYSDSISQVSKELSLTDAGCLLKLLPNMKLNGGGVLVKGETPLKKADIEKIIGRTKTATRDIVGRLEKVGILKCEKDGRNNVYSISPEFHVFGNGGNGGDFTKLLKVEASKVLDKLTVSEAGLLYKITPYIHFSQYMLCKNANSGPNDKLERLSRDELGEIMELDEDSITRLMRGLLKKGVIANFNTNRKTHYYVRPTLVFRGHKSEHYATVMQMFKNCD